MLVLQQSRKLPAIHFRCVFVDAKVDLICASIARQAGLSELLTECIVVVLDKLYHDSHLPSPGNVRSVTIFLDHMDSVAYTTGSPLDNDHKEIHLSISYFTRPDLIADQSRANEELRGVLVHELVHCFQYNANGTAPGGFIEGMADYVRYKADLSPPHWRLATRPGTASKWDDGYQHTAFFLLWLNYKYGKTIVTSLNEVCKDRKWSDSIFRDLTSHDLPALWKSYCDDHEWNPYP